MKNNDYNEHNAPVARADSGPASNGMKHRFAAAPGEKLTDNERALLRERLSRHMAMNPVAAMPIAIARHSQLSWSLYLGRAGAFAALVLVLGGGISYAAQSSVPGDFLYAVKRSVNEPVTGALALSTHAKADWSAELASRRLSEAEELASRGKLDSAVAAQLSAEAEENAHAAAERIAVLGASDPDGAAVAAVKLTASLSAHGSILTSLGEEDSAAHITAALGSEGELEFDAPQAKSASASGQMVSTFSAHSDPNASSTSASSRRVPAFKKAALEARENAAAALSKAEASLGSDDLGKAVEALAQVDASLTAAANAEGEWEAERHYREALREAQSLAVILKAASSWKSRSFLGGKKPAAPAASPSAQATSTDQGEAQDRSDRTDERSASMDSSVSAEADASASGESAEEGRRNTIERILAPLLR